MITRRSMCMNVRGCIYQLREQRSKKTYITDDAGRPLNKEEAISAMMDELEKGHKVIPMNAQCGNPCKQSCACPGFDYTGGGCPGYEVPGEVE